MKKTNTATQTQTRAKKNLFGLSSHQLKLVIGGTGVIPSKP
jgi:hypothetical protein